MKQSENEFKFITEENRIYMKNDDDKVVAEITFPETKPAVFTIDHTFVDKSLRGKGMASKLVQAAVDEIEKRNATVQATCWYAARWIEEQK